MSLVKISTTWLITFICMNNLFAGTNDYTKGLVRSEQTFKCGGIAVIDKGMALDRPGLFFDVKTQEYLCTYGMVKNTCSFTGVNQPCICPPSEWTDNNCSKEFSEFNKQKHQKELEKLKMRSSPK